MVTIGTTRFNGSKDKNCIPILYLWVLYTLHNKQRLVYKRALTGFSFFLESVSCEVETEFLNTIYVSFML
jgi:hypothetical protein